MVSSEPLAQLHEDHEALDALMTRLEWFVLEPTGRRATAVAPLLAQLVERLSAHIRFEEVHFYAPLKAARQAREDLVAILTAEHEDLLQTVEQLQQVQHRPDPWDDEVFLAYATHLIEVYREHTDREHRWLFPLLEQPPSPAALSSVLITKDATLNAVTKRFPKLLEVLHIAGLDRPWCGCDTLEEVAWHHGMDVESLLGTLNQALDQQRNLC